MVTERNNNNNNNFLMFIDEIKQKIQKEWETLIQTVRIYSDDIGM